MRGVLHSALLGLMAGVAVLAYAFPYFALSGSWWRAIPSTAAIGIIGVFVAREQAPTLLGLRLTARGLLASFLVFVVAVLASNEIILGIVGAGPLVAQARHTPLGAVHQFFQVLNDEMILRAALLTLVLQVMPYPKSVALASGLAFSMGHHLVYQLNGVHVGTGALLTLFSFGVLTNLFFLRFRHIGYGLALHYGWNLTRFGYVYTLDGRFVSEGMSFNYLEGNAWVVAASTCAAAVAFVAHTVRPPSNSIRPLVLADAPQHRKARQQ